jgi:Uma2 family endonuclease
MAMPGFTVPTTADELDALPSDGNRYEIVDGELFVTPTPSRGHQQAQMLLIARMLPYVEPLHLDLMAAPTDVRANHNSQVEPDLLVLPRKFEGRSANRWEPMTRVLLTVEILSRSTARADREVKRRLYMAQGVREYWIVDVAAREVQVWKPAGALPLTIRDTLMWRPVDDAAPLRIDLVTLFDRVSDDD